MRRPERVGRAALPGLAFTALAVFYLRTLGHPSLWLDEAWEANYYVGIVPAPWYNRPVLYMGEERLMARLFGPGEFVLRLLPCLAGLATIAATWWLVRRTMGRACAWLAAGLLAIAPTFLYESHQLKHYTFDALFTVLLLIVYLRYREEPSVRRLAAFAATALVSFGFSFTSIFVLAAIGLVHGASAIAGHRSDGASARAGAPRDPSPGAGLALFVGVNVLLLGAFAAIYVTFHASAQGDTLLKDYFVEAWAPWSDPLALPGWLARQSRVLAEMAGASSFVAFALLLAAGVRRELGGRAPRLFAAVTGVCLLVLVATSAVHLYPYGSARLTLFLAPLVCALAAAGILEAFGIPGDAPGAGAAGGTWPGSPGRLGWRRWPQWPRYLAAGGLLYVLLYPALDGARPYLSRGWGTDELRRSIAALAREHTPGEGIFVPERASASFPYYWWRAGKGTDAADVVWGERHRLHPRDHAPQMARVADTYRSLWVIFDDQSREEREILRGLLLERYESVRREGAREAESVELFRRRDAKTGEAVR